MCLCIPAACWSALGYYYATEHRQPVRSVSGVYLECIWSVSGVYLGCIWSVSGVCIWSVSGVSVSGVYLGCIWSVSGMYLECIWNVSGVYLGVSGMYLGRVIWRVIRRVIWGHLWTSGAQGALRAHGPFECSKHMCFTMKSDRGDHFTSTKWPQCYKKHVKHNVCKHVLSSDGNLPGSR